MRKILCFSILLLSLSTLSAPIFAGDGSSQGFGTDSTDITPPTLTEASAAKVGFVLGTGSYMLLCDDKHSEFCNETVTSTQCPAGYSPQATVSSIWNSYVYIYPLRKIVLYSSDETTNGAIIPIDNGQGGYQLHFDQAYAEFVGALAKNQPVDVDFSIDCIPT